MWDAVPADGDEPSLVLSLKSPDGDCGFPGNAEVTVTYTLTKDNALMIHYEATADADTLMNMTNHTYFNLNGHASGRIDNHRLWLDSSFYTPNRPDAVPTGEILCVKGTPFDFTGDRTIGEGLLSGYEQIAMFGGYDHNFALNGVGYRKSAVLKGDKSGIVMEMYTDRPGVQLYSAMGCQKGVLQKEGAEYGPYNAVCLETQCFPGSTSYSHFPGAVLRKGDKYDTVTTYKFIQE